MSAADLAMSELEVIRAREADPETLRLATLRANAVQKRLDTKLLASLAQRARLEPSKPKKIFWLRKLAEPLVQATKGIAPCRDGCSHCCHIPLLMTAVEARVIAQETGAVLHNADAFAPDINRHYVGVACPFLKNDRCSIYESRPFQCRIFYNMDRDDLLCTLVDDRPTLVPYYNQRPWNFAFVDALLPDVQCADIRDFFGSAPQSGVTPCR